MVKMLRAKYGQKILVDDEYYDIVKVFHWYVTGITNGVGGLVQAPMSLARLILLREFSKRKAFDPSVEVDHINGNPLDNRRQNLRLVTRSENQHFKWKRLAIRRLLNGIKCQHGRGHCSNQATKLIRRTKRRRYIYLCKHHTAKGETMELA